MIRRSLVALFVALFVLLSLAAATPASAQGLTLPKVHERLAFSEQGPAAPTWQQQFDATQAKKTSGKNKMIIGLVMIGAGTATAVSSAGDVTCESSGLSVDCDSGSAGKIGLLANIAGTGVFAWGAFQFYEAPNELNRIGPQGTTTLIASARDRRSSSQAGACRA